MYPPHPSCMPGDILSIMSVYAHFVVLGLVISNSTSAHKFGCQETSGAVDIRCIKIQ